MQTFTIKNRLGLHARAAALLVKTANKFASEVTIEKDAQAGTNPCSALSRVCRYKWNPVERCCVADPRFDRIDVCY